MSFEEALQVLGIAPDVGADGARRAYLRLTKTHKPERDPDGFRRIREAYDVVAPQIEWRAALSALPTVLATEPSAATDELGLEDPEASDDDDDYDFDDSFEPDGLERPVETANAALAAFQAGEFPALFPGTLLRLLLTLDARFEGDLAAELFAALVTWNERMGDERRTFGEVALAWHLVEEYFALRPELSPDARALVADSLRDLNWALAAKLAAAWNPGEQRGDRAREQARRVLRRSKPLRAIVFGSTRWGKAGEVLLRVSVPAAVAVFMLWFSPFSRKEPDENVESQTRAIIDGATNDQVKMLADSLAHSECTAARVYLHHLTGAPDARSTPEIEVAIAKLRPIARANCPRVIFPPATLPAP